MYIKKKYYDETNVGVKLLAEKTALKLATKHLP